MVDASPTAPADGALPPLDAGPIAPLCGSTAPSASRNPDLDWAAWRVPADVPTAYSVGSDTVCDEVTGLHWQRVGSSTWGENVETGCPNRLSSGTPGWRLPSIVELVSIASYDGAGVDGAAFTVQPGCFWASTPGHAEPFGYGQFVMAIPGGEAQGLDVSSGCRWLCVWSDGNDPSLGGPGAPAGRYVTRTTTVTDTMTHLTWQRASFQASAGVAAAACSTVVLAGVSGWRLPRVKELFTLSDHADGGNLDATAFPADRASPHWSSTPHAGAPCGQTWTVDFSTGVIVARAATDIVSVRCVRP